VSSDNISFADVPSSLIFCEDTAWNAHLPYDRRLMASLCRRTLARALKIYAVI